MRDFYLNIYRNSIFGSMAVKLTTFIMWLWHGSFFRRLFFGEWKIGFAHTIEFQFFAKVADASVILGFITHVDEWLHGWVRRVYEGSLFLRLVGSFFGVKNISDYRGIGLVLVTVICIPILPTIYILVLCSLSIALFTGRFIFARVAVRFCTADFFVALLGIIILISIPNSYIPSESAKMGLVYILFILFYFVVRNLIDTEEKLCAVMSGLLLSGALVAVLGILQKITGHSFMMTEAWIDIEMFDEMSTRVYATLANPNVLGSYLIFVVLFGFAGMYYFRNWFYKLVSLGICAAAVICIVYTLSRGAWLGLVFALGLYTLFQDRRLIWLGLFALPMLPFVIPESVLERMLSIGNLEDTSSTYRLYIWLASLEMIKDFWPIGIGPGTRVFVYIYQKYSYSTIYAPHSHNLFLQLIIDYGISGLILFASVIFLFYRSYLSNLKHAKDRFLTAAGAAVCAAMGGYLLQGITDNVWYNYRIVAFFWVMVALVVAFGEVMKKRGANSNA